MVFGLEIVHGNLVQVGNVIWMESDGRQEPHGNAQPVQNPVVVLGPDVLVAEGGLQCRKDKAFAGRYV